MVAPLAGGGRLPLLVRILVEPAARAAEQAAVAVAAVVAVSAVVCPSRSCRWRAW